MNATAPQPLEAEPIEIDGHIIDPGTAADVTIPVSREVSGFTANLMLRVINGVRPGPTVFISGAVHGDEIIGTAIIQRLAERIAPDTLAGAVILVPVVNIYGFLSNSRYLPDRRDLNRSFPGSSKGSLAGQLAQCFLENVIEKSSLGIDIHSAAIHRYNLPQIRIAEDDPYLTELAMAFGAPVIVESPLRVGSMRELARSRGVPMLLLEAGEALRFDRLSIDIGTHGVLRVLAHLKMQEWDDGMDGVGTPARTNSSTWVRAPRGGVAHFVHESGDTVRAGDVLAQVSGLFGEESADVIAPVDGIVIGHATLPVVNQGDALFHIAKVAHLERAGQRIDNITETVLASEPVSPTEPQLDEDEILQFGH